MLKWLRANTLGTYLLTRFHGEFVGEDGAANRYYRRKRPGGWRTERRWVVYADETKFDGSLVPPGWQGWLTHQREKSPERGSATDQALGKGASAQSERHCARLCAARPRAARRPACSGYGRLRGMAPVTAGRPARR